MKKNILKLSVFFLALVITTSCEKENEPPFQSSEKEILENNDLSSIQSKGGFDKSYKIGHKEYKDRSTAAFTKLHKKLVKAYYKNHPKIKSSMKASVVDEHGLSIPMEELLLEMNDDIAQEYLVEMHEPSYMYLESNYELDSLDCMSQEELVVLAFCGMSFTDLDEAGYQIDGIVNLDDLDKIAPGQDPESLSYRIGACLGKALGSGILVSIKDLNLTKMKIADAMKFVRTTFIKTAGCYITGAVMAYEFGVCMGWLYDIFQRDK